jgi:hypothetical protein
MDEKAPDPQNVWSLFQFVSEINRTIPLGQTLNIIWNKGKGKSILTQSAFSC